MGYGQEMLGGQVTKSDLDQVESQLRTMRNKLRRDQNTDRSQDRELHALRRENDTLKLYLSALIRILVSRGVVSEHELERIAAIIDAEDGHQDGKYDGDVV